MRSCFYVAMASLPFNKSFGYKWEEYNLLWIILSQHRNIFYGRFPLKKDFKSSLIIKNMLAFSGLFSEFNTNAYYWHKGDQTLKAQRFLFISNLFNKKKSINQDQKYFWPKSKSRRFWNFQENSFSIKPYSESAVHYLTYLL